MMRFAARLVARRPLPAATRPAQRRLGSTDSHGHGHDHSHGHGHDGPNGYLFNVPVRLCQNQRTVATRERRQLTLVLAGLSSCPRSQPGHAAPNEGWELSYYVGMFGGFLLAAVGLTYKPDTKYGSVWRADCAYFGRVLTTPVLYHFLS